LIRLFSTDSKSFAGRNSRGFHGLSGAGYQPEVFPMLTLDLVDRLLASTLVPRHAKLAAVESWRNELAAMRDKRHEYRRLEQRLAEASRLLAAPWWLAAAQYVARVLALGAGPPNEARPVATMRATRASSGPPSYATDAWR
jgi:hypothetical protein